jgi:hypothetical protein
MCHNYQVITERLKLNLLLIADFEGLNLNNPHETSLGSIINKLKKEFPDNKFVE